MEKGKQYLGRAYQEHSRQKYNKYKHQYPSWKQSEIVRKIIQDWQGMSIHEHMDLAQKYIKNGCYAWPPPPRKKVVDQNGIQRWTQSPAPPINKFLSDDKPIVEKQRKKINIFPPPGLISKEDSPNNLSAVASSPSSASHSSICRRRRHKRYRQRKKLTYSQFFESKYVKLAHQIPTYGQAVEIIRKEWFTKVTSKGKKKEIFVGPPNFDHFDHCRPWKYYTFPQPFW